MDFWAAFNSRRSSRSCRVRSSTCCRARSRAAVASVAWPREIIKSHCVSASCRRAAESSISICCKRWLSIASALPSCRLVSSDGLPVPAFPGPPVSSSNSSSSGSRLRSEAGATAAAGKGGAATEGLGRIQSRIASSPSPPTCQPSGIEVAKRPATRLNIKTLRGLECLHR